MKKAILLLTMAVSLLASCKKDSGNNSTSRKIKYEITGTFTGKLNIVYSDNINGNTTLNNISLPWTKEIAYGSNVLTIAIGSQASVMGVAGQTANLKIYSNGAVVKTSAATAGSSGELLIPTVSHSF